MYPDLAGGIQFGFPDGTEDAVFLLFAEKL
jgi:hypothetical protein